MRRLARHAPKDSCETERRAALLQAVEQIRENLRIIVLHRDLKHLTSADTAVAYKKGGRTLAILTISRDLKSLQAEAAMELKYGRKDKEVA